MILSPKTLERILDCACAGGVDFAEVFCEETQRNTINVRNSGVGGSSWGRENGVGVRVFSGWKGYYG